MCYQKLKLILETTEKLLHHVRIKTENNEKGSG